eukprot:6492628-Amphidinium_carterae.3
MVYNSSCGRSRGGGSRSISSNESSSGEVGGAGDGDCPLLLPDSPWLLWMELCCVVGDAGVSCCFDTFWAGCLGLAELVLQCGAPPETCRVLGAWLQGVCCGDLDLMERPLVLPGWMSWKRCEGAAEEGELKAVTGGDLEQGLGLRLNCDGMGCVGEISMGGACAACGL